VACPASGKVNNRFLKKVITVVVLLIIVLNVLISVFHEPEMQGEEYTETMTRCVEDAIVDSVGNATHWRMWEEYALNEIYCANYSIEYGQAYDASAYRNSLVVNEERGPFEFWRDIYHALYMDARDRLAVLQDSLRSAGEGKALGREAFARMIVSFVQDIPYQYVLSEGCGAEKGPCNPNVRWGIYSPVEFVYSLKGDCDTRTVLLYTLLKNFGYSPVIINSIEYRHSMLALDIPSAGDDFLYKGRRYAFWETTNVGWLPGMLPPEMNNKNYWQVALDYEHQDQPVRLN
jgi:hypothetical protein